MSTPISRAIAREVLAERDAQDAVRVLNLPDGTDESFRPESDALKARANAGYADGTLAWSDLLLEDVWEALAEVDPVNLRAALVQVSALSQAWISALDDRMGTAYRSYPDRSFSAAHARVLFLLAAHQGATDAQLSRRWAAKATRAGALAWPFISEAGLRSRRAELVRWGLVVSAGRDARTMSNKPTQTWQPAVAEPRAGDGFEPVPPATPEARAAFEALLDEAGDDVVIRVTLRDAMRYAAVTS